MNRIINNAELVMEDAMLGHLKAHRDLVAPTDNPRVIRRHLAPQQGKVVVVTGGGSGREPAFMGKVGGPLSVAIIFEGLAATPQTDRKQASTADADISTRFSRADEQVQ